MVGFFPSMLDFIHHTIHRVVFNGATACLVLSAFSVFFNGLMAVISGCLQQDGLVVAE